MSHPDMLERIVDWARARPEVHALVLTGSKAQPGASIDSLSDIDIEVVVADVQEFMAGGQWWNELGEVWTTQVVPALAAAATQTYPMVGVIYAGATTVDFTVIDAQRLSDMAEGGELDRVYAPGYRVLLDPDGLTDALPKPSGGGVEPAVLTPDGFRAVADAFWFEALRVPKYLIRGELWEAKSREWTMKQHLLVMVEWHAVVTAGYPFDGYHKGRHLSRWVDARTWQQAHEVFGRFEAADAWRALEASVRLFDRLACEAAREWGLQYPTAADEAIAAHLRTLADEHSAQTSPRIMPNSLVKSFPTAR